MDRRLDARLVSAPSARRYTPPTTLRLPPAPLQPDRGRVASLVAIVMEPKLSEICIWCAAAAAQIDFGVRTCKTPVVEQQHVFPARRGVVWDLRTKGDGGLYGPADFQAPIATHPPTSTRRGGLECSLSTQTKRSSAPRSTALSFEPMYLSQLC